MSARRRSADGGEPNPPRRRRPRANGSPNYRTGAGGFPAVSLEASLADQEWDNGWMAATELSGIQLLGDDLFVTDAARLEHAF
ncbi:hypothetical protein ACFZC5_19120 [Nocardia gamkensis]|uniref:hypothetical protein n=1 Tax=Nocardia gamkensis TaxID=352869 RepID=UPI0036EC4FCE